eukprot:scaffold159277_cov14-Tisochrysis_lutea.AAC.1
MAAFLQAQRENASLSKTLPPKALSPQTASAARLLPQKWQHPCSHSIKQGSSVCKAGHRCCCNGGAPVLVVKRAASVCAVMGSAPAALHVQENAGES